MVGNEESIYREEQQWLGEPNYREEQQWLGEPNLRQYSKDSEQMKIKCCMLYTRHLIHVFSKSHFIAFITAMSLCCKALHTATNEFEHNPP